MSRVSYQQLLKQIRTNPNWSISYPFYNSLLFGCKLELQYLPQIIHPHEMLYYMTPGLYNNARELLVVTNERIMFIDCRILRRASYSQINIKKINDVNMHHGFFFSTLTLSTGNDTQHIISGIWGDDVEKAKKAIDRVLNEKFEEPVQSQTSSYSENSVQQLMELQKMKKDGALTDEEFQKMKDRIINS